jgi:hypothetical protein
LPKDEAKMHDGDTGSTIISVHSIFLPIKGVPSFINQKLSIQF